MIFYHRSTMTFLFDQSPLLARSLICNVFSSMIDDTFNTCSILLHWICFITISYKGKGTSRRCTSTSTGCTFTCNITQRDETDSEQQNVECIEGINHKAKKSSLQVEKMSQKESSSEDISQSENCSTQLQ